MTEIEILKFERKIKTKLPETYRNFILGRFEIKDENERYLYYKTNSGHDDCVHVDEIYTFEQLPKNKREIVRQYGFGFPEGLLFENFLIIGQSYGCGYFLLSVKDPNIDQVRLWDIPHQDFEDTDIINNSFKGFISMLSLERDEDEF